MYFLKKKGDKMIKFTKPKNSPEINWGYAVCDAAMRRHVDNGLPAPAAFPYPASGVG